MARLVEGTVFPAVSFGPISHALCRLIPSKNRTVASCKSYMSCPPPRILKHVVRFCEGSEAVNIGRCPEITGDHCRCSSNYMRCYSRMGRRGGPPPLSSYPAPPPPVVVQVLCLRELLGAVQTLTWDKVRCPSCIVSGTERGRVVWLGWLVAGLCERRPAGGHPATRHGLRAGRVLLAVWMLYRIT